MTITYRLLGGQIWEYAQVDPGWLEIVGLLLKQGTGVIHLTNHPGECLRSADDSHLIRIPLLDRIEVTP